MLTKFQFCRFQRRQLISRAVKKGAANIKSRQQLEFRRFDTLLEAKVLIERWRVEHNTVRPHSSLGSGAIVSGLDAGVADDRSRIDVLLDEGIVFPMVPLPCRLGAVLDDIMLHGYVLRVVVQVDAGHVPLLGPLAADNVVDLIV